LYKIERNRFGLFVGFARFYWNSGCYCTCITYTTLLRCYDHTVALAQQCFNKARTGSQFNRPSRLPQCNIICH